MRRLLIRTFTVLILISLFLSGIQPASQPARAQDEAPTDIPTALVASGVTSYTLKEPKVFWHTGVPPCPPTGEEEPQVQYPEMVRRVASYGSTTRTLYYKLRDCAQGEILSNIVSDGTFLYWLDPVGLVKLSTDANPGDVPVLMNALVDAPGEVMDGGDKIFVISTNIGGSNTQVYYVRKDNNARVFLATPGNYASNLQYDGKYVYYLVGTTLYRIEPGVSGPVSIVASGVNGYFPEGNRLIFCTINPFQCYYSDNVYVGMGDDIRVYNNKTGSLGAPIYTSVDNTATMVSLATDFFNLYFLERRTIACSPQPCFNSYVTVVQRTWRSGGAADSLYTSSPTIFGGPSNLKTNGTFIFWHEDSKVQRLPNNASALPMVNMYVTGMEITQGIQNLSNSVLLVKGKRTFVRVFVRSAGDAVSGVGARLTAPALGGNPLQPVNPAGTKLTVRQNPDKDDIDQSFLFELPWSWTQNPSLQLRFEMNPYKVPLEPNYADNNLTQTFNFQNSPTLSVEFFNLNYKIGGTTYTPRYIDDVVKTHSWIMRAYPIGGAVGENFKPRLWDVNGGTWLGGLVNQSNPLCKLFYSGKNDDPALCASLFTNGLLYSYRIRTLMGLLNVGLKANAFYYGMISDASNNFPRGQAMYTKTSVGPAGTPGQFFGLGQGWDTDGSYADWYAAHEIGHSLGRAHPNAGSDNPATKSTSENCGHSRSDPGYPYGNTSTSRAPIGPADDSMEGFDVGDPYFGIQRAVLPSDTWNDVMSYCNSQWISDYTYTAMYNNMIANPSALEESTLEASAPQVGDYLAAAGVINPDTHAAGFSYLSRLDSVVNVPGMLPGDYSLHLLDNDNSLLAYYDFTPELNYDTGLLGFGVVVDFVPGTRVVQIVYNGDGSVIASQPVSANPPSVSNVHLQGASNPVEGLVTLAWSASDPDGDALTFEVAYSKDNGVSFHPVTAGLSGSSTQIDTAMLGGSGTAILRLIASDGANSAYADSPSFVMANKPPIPFILTPQDGLQIHYGQLVNFSGMALDAQDGTVANAGLSWWDAGNNLLGSGALLSLDALPVGANLITLKATNSKGQTATIAITVYVDDDLDLPGPTLTAGPSPVSWHVNAGSTGSETADVSINNAGSGNMDWNASEDAAWLSLSAPSGTVTSSGDPSTLTLSANPTGLAGGATYAAKLTITTTMQTVTIPVSLSVGDIHSVPVSLGNTGTIFLPVIIR